eukprot:TRINITY_DN2853_c0_g1_i1.p1 TRINITY_DN2853_c0_g1~~TRINITY_DN2853_c0_g1_i1.p1  ORF type:complete len:329 (+),score=105.79 TRINITY_DN2853_c0_g1_i1:182-1168(+)
MQSDDVVWKILNRQHCAFKLTAKVETFCRNPYNFTGLCRKSACPLSNSRYATVREKKGVVYLYMKTVERAHLPSQLWEKVKLDRNYQKALAQIDHHLMHWPTYIGHRCKQRLTRITQYLIKMRKLKLKPGKKLVPIKPKEERQQKKREAKALIAAKLDRAIEKELINRLQSGLYDEDKDVLNMKPEVFNRAIEQLERSESEDSDVDLEDDEEDSEEEEEEGGEKDNEDSEDESEEDSEEEEEEEEEGSGMGNVEPVEDEDEFVEDLSDIEDFGEFEYEFEKELPAREKHTTTTTTSSKKPKPPALPPAGSSPKSPGRNKRGPVNVGYE